MSADASTYTSADMQSRLRTQAYRVWIVTALALLLWVAMIVAAPVLHLSGVHSFFGYICHQIPERSFHIAGEQFAVCSRCFGVYFGLLLGVVVFPLWRHVEETEPIARVWLFASLVPITVDWSLAVFGIWENTHLSRFVTGLILGLACATFILPALVEIIRNLSGRTVRG